jgi:predicted ester cyclase
MRRAVVPIAIVLALVSGVVLAEARLVVLAPIVADGTDPRVQANDALIRRFYAAVNGALASGDVDPLSRIVDADFVDHAPRPGSTTDHAGFVGAVQALHAVVPGLRLTVLDALAEGDHVVARVGIEDGGGGTFLGLSIADTQLWGSVDVFRVEAGHLVEHWGASATLGQFDPLLEVTVPVERPTRKALTLERWTYGPDGGETRATDLGFMVVLVDTGTLTIELDAHWSVDVRLTSRGSASGATNERRVEPGETVTLEAGDDAVVPQGNRMSVRNDGSVQAVALVVQAMTPVPQPGLVSGAGGATEETRIVHQVLAGGLTANLPAGQATVAIGRAALAAGTELLAHRVDIAELVAVETGTLQVTADDGTAWVTSQIEGTHRGDGETVPTGGGVLVDAGTVAGYGASGDAPLGVLLVAVGAVGTDPIATGAATASSDQATAP